MVHKVVRYETNNSIMDMLAGEDPAFSSIPGTIPDTILNTNPTSRSLHRVAAATRTHAPTAQPAAHRLHRLLRPQSPPR
jgi:hypothetical protein